VNWLIDADQFDGYRDDLVACIRSLGHEVRFVHTPSPPYRWEDEGCSYRRAFPKDACVVTHGDIELVTRVRREKLWKPGAFATIEKFACSSYYRWFGRFILNQDHVMLPFGELDRKRDYLFDKFGTDNRIFIRPDSPLKFFTGQVATRDTFDADLEFMAFHEFPTSSIVIFSSAKSIRAEWRFVVANRKIVAGCQYKSDGQLDLQPHYEPAAFDLAGTIAAEEYQPDHVWVMDICQTDANNLHLLEIGGFSFSDLYLCDKLSIVKAVSEAATQFERASSVP
jgi:hypothetical protein